MGSVGGGPRPSNRPLISHHNQFSSASVYPSKGYKMYPEAVSDGEIQTCSYIFKIKARFSRGLTLETNLSAGRREQVAGTPVVPGAVPVNCASFSLGCRGAGV